MVAPFAKEHVARVAELHCRRLKGLLSAMGPRTASAFYEGYLSSDRCVAFVDEHEGVVRGFVLGSTDPEAMRRDALRANPGGILFGTLAAALRRPGLVRHLADGARGVGGSGFDPRAPELTYIAVREDSRGAGVGSALLTAFQSALRERGVGRYELSVEAANEDAVAFYESRGLRLAGTYRQFGTAYRRYATELPAPGGEAR